MMILRKLKAYQQKNLKIFKLATLRHDGVTEILDFVVTPYSA